MSATVIITNSLGLHARTAMAFQQVASQYRCAISVSRTDRAEVVDGKTVLGLLQLAAAPGTELRIDASGGDAAPAVEALVALVASGFSEA